MTVRVNKPSFNIREKLSELGRKFGLKGSELAAAETVQEAREIVSAGRRNIIIMGQCGPQRFELLKVVYHFGRFVFLIDFKE